MSNFRREENYEDYEDNSFEYTQEDLDSMYQGAFEGDPEAYWNID